MTTGINNANVVTAILIRGLLFASGLLAAGIAATILLAPETFYIGYGIDVRSNINLANELKAPSGLLLIAGLLMLIGVFRSAFVVPSLAIATTIYLSYGASRLLSLMIDGVPGNALLGAAVVEIAVGLACFLGLAVLRRAEA